MFLRKLMFTSTSNQKLKEFNKSDFIADIKESVRFVVKFYLWAVNSLKIIFPVTIVFVCFVIFCDIMFNRSFEKYNPGDTLANNCNY